MSGVRASQEAIRSVAVESRRFVEVGRLATRQSSRELTAELERAREELRRRTTLARQLGEHAIQAAAAAEAARGDDSAGAAGAARAAQEAKRASRRAEDSEKSARRAVSTLEDASRRLHSAERRYQASLDRAEHQLGRLAVLASALDSYARPVSLGSTPATGSASPAAPPGGTHGSAEAARTIGPPLPGGTQLVPLSDIDLSDSPVSSPSDFERLSTEDGVWMLEETEVRLLPAVRAGRTRDDLVARDRAEGRSGNRSYARLYDTTFGERAIRLSRRPDGRYEVTNGYHRLWLAQQHGFRHVVARIR